MKYLLILTLSIFTLSLSANENPLPFERHDSEHIKEILKAWEKDKGAYLYESMNALIMHKQQPERPNNVYSTPFEMLQKMDNNRIKRLERAAESELKREKENSSRTQSQFYWEEWLQYLRSTDCNANKGRSIGDPHLTTYDGTKFDFQNAGDYLLTASNDNTFMVQTQQYRLDKSIALNGAIIVNINGDVLEFGSLEKNNPRKGLFVNGEKVATKTDVLLPQGGVVNYINEKYWVKWPTGEQMQVWKRKFKEKPLYGIYIYVPQCRNDYYGILGNNDGKENDIYTIDSVTNERVQYENYEFSDEETFGEMRNNPNVREKRKDEAYFIHHLFANQFQLDSTTSLFPRPKVSLSDSIRYPAKNLSLAELDDEEIKIGIQKAKKAGVKDENLFAAVYDYGHMGLEPQPYGDEYERIKPADSSTPPKLSKDGDRLQEKEEEKERKTIRISPGVFIGTGVRIIRSDSSHPHTQRKPHHRKQGKVPSTSRRR